MKKLILSILILICFQNIFSQAYYTEFDWPVRVTYQNETLDIIPGLNTEILTNNDSLTIGFFNDSLLIILSNDTTVIRTVNSNPISIPNLVEAGYWLKDGSDIYYNDGNVGIGTNAPSLTYGGLHIKGSGADMKLESTSSNAMWVDYTHDDTRKALFIYRPVDAAFKIVHDEAAASTAGDDLVVKNGYVGCSQISPAYELDVSGDINFTDDLYKDDVLFVEGLWQDDGNYISPIEADGVNVEYDDFYRVGGNIILGFNGSTWSTLKVGFGTGNGGSNNTHVGLYTGRGSTTAEKNTYIGASAGDNTTTGISNTAVGYQSMGVGNTTGEYNATFGFRSGRALSSGIYNTFIGTSAGDAMGIGSYNTFVGQASGAIQIGSYNTYLGNMAGSGVYNQNYCIAIGNEAGKYNTKDSVLHIDIEGYADESGCLDSTLLFADFANNYLKFNADSLFRPGAIAQFHRIDSIDVSTANSWVTVKFDTAIMNESTYGYRFNSDSTGFITSLDADTRVQGCGHWIWRGANNANVKIYVRITIDGVEARCLQANQTRGRNTLDDGTVPFIGTIHHDADAEIKLQYQVSNTSMDFEGSTVFDTPVSFSINFEDINDH